VKADAINDAATLGVAPVRRRILLSCFACSPQWGSEPGVGWQWLLQIARHHEVVLLTHSYFRSHIEPALQQLGLTIEVHYFEIHAFGLHPHKQLNSRLYYSVWQWRVRRLAKRLLSERPFDLVHHLTWGSLRFPCLLGGLGVPLVMGPLGGGEKAPMRLFSGLPIKIQAFDYLRSITLMLARFDPLATWGPRRAALVLCRSDDSRRALPPSVQARALVAPEIGSPAVDVSQRLPANAAAGGESGRRTTLLFAGRLLGWKGVALALGATARLVRQGHNVQLDIAGEGPLRDYLAQQIEVLELQGRVRLLGVVAREALMTLYAQSDLFVFPSLHDSSGSVMLESLSRGLPVVCLDLGGPKNYVNEQCGVVVSTAGLTRDLLEQKLAEVIGGLLAEPQRLASMSCHAAEHARQQSWENTVRGAYQLIDRQMRWSQP
jgi:glycosyltransferase involved in cell wall biosynthesis